VAFLGVCALAFAAFMAGAFVTDMVRSAQVRRRGVTVTGDVIGINTRVGIASVSRSRVVRFTTDHAGLVTVTMPPGRLRDVPVGGRTQVRYLPERPQVARPPGGRVRHFSWLFGIAVIVFVGVALLIS
jgi:hypothetical protein